MSLATIFSNNLNTMAELASRMDRLAQPLERAAALIQSSVSDGHKLLACGNGGSACDAAHFTAEIAGRFVIERRGYPAIDLTADHSILTALINDYPPEEVFARQVIAQGRPGDTLAVFSSSGNSENVRRALLAGRDSAMHTVAFLGKDGGTCKGLAEVDLIVPHPVTARVQEMHLLMYHSICEAIDPVLAELAGTARR